MTERTTEEDAVGTNFGFVDAHHHLWDLSACRYPWLLAKGEKRFFGDPTPIQKDYLSSDFLSESARFRPIKSVHIQVGTDPDDWVRETAWLESLGEYPQAIVAACDLSAANRDDLLSQHQAYPRVRGIRQIIGRHRDEDPKHDSDQLIESPEFLRGLQKLSAENLSFDLQLIPEQMHRVAQLLKQVPDLDVALCHCGSPWDQSPAGIEQWRDGLMALADLPRMHCKVSGLGMFNPHWTADQLQPIISTVIELFGAERVMFGSNFPVDKLYCSYDKLWSAYEAILQSYSWTQQEQMLVGTASAFYQLNQS